jgi:ribosome-associated heat shock protein Hsp15
MDKIRIDKWLWTVRIFKSRTLSSDHCKAAKVKQNGKLAKPSTLVAAGDSIELKRGGFTFTFKVNQVLKSRVSAQLALAAYTDLTPADELNKYKAWFSVKTRNEYREKGTGRPTKKERRDITEFKDIPYGTDFEYDFDEEE